MERIELKRAYVAFGHEFEIRTSLSRTSQSIVTMIRYVERSGGNHTIQINSDYVNPQKLREHYDFVWEKCDSIGERLSGWKNVIETLTDDGFDIIELEAY